MTQPKNSDPHPRDGVPPPARPETSAGWVVSLGVVAVILTLFAFVEPGRRASPSSGGEPAVGGQVDQQPLVTSVPRLTTPSSGDAAPAAPPTERPPATVESRLTEASTEPADSSGQRVAEVTETPSSEPTPDQSRQLDSLESLVQRYLASAASERRGTTREAYMLAAAFLADARTLLETNRPLLGLTERFQSIEAAVSAELDTTIVRCRRDGMLLGGGADALPCPRRPR